jgi:hypothetical protein
MMRWGIALLLLGLFIATFFSGGVGGQFIEVGKWFFLIGAVLMIIFAVAGSGTTAGPRTHY